jgi:hypothetical protein
MVEEPKEVFKRTSEKRAGLTQEQAVRARIHVHKVLSGGKRTRVPPRILRIKNWGLIGGEWTPFGNWQAHLGKVVQAGPRRPELLVARKGDHDWPWTLCVDEFKDWDDQPVMMWARKRPTPRNRLGRKRRSR